MNDFTIGIGICRGELHSSHCAEHTIDKRHDQRKANEDILVGKAVVATNFYQTIYSHCVLIVTGIKSTVDVVATPLESAGIGFFSI